MNEVTMAQKRKQKKNYKFTNKRHSEKAVMSTVFGALSLISLVTVIYLAYINAGEAPVNYGFSGILILIFAITGLVLAMKGSAAREELAEAKNAITQLGLKLEEIRDFTFDGATHSVIVLRKVKATPARFPRRFSKIKQSPL